MELSFLTPYTAMDSEREDRANRDRGGERKGGQRKTERQKGREKKEDKECVEGQLQG